MTQDCNRTHVTFADIIETPTATLLSSSTRGKHGRSNEDSTGGLNPTPGGKKTVVKRKPSSSLSRKNKSPVEPLIPASSSVTNDEDAKDRITPVASSFLSSSPASTVAEKKKGEDDDSEKEEEEEEDLHSTYSWIPPGISCKQQVCVSLSPSSYFFLSHDSEK